MPAMGVARMDWVFAAVFCAIVPYVLEGLDPYVRVQSLDDPLVMRPHLPDIVPSYFLILLSLLLPIGVFFASVCVCGASFSLLSFEAFMLGLVEANGLTVSITNVLKLFVGRPRPHFAAVCVSYVVGSETQCSGNAQAVREARKSFPSGHSSLAFAAAVYTSAYIAHGLSVGKSPQQQRRIANFQPPSSWKLISVLIPLVLASLVAASRTRDFHHNYDDILAGSLIGSAISALVVYHRMASVTSDATIPEYSENDARHPQEVLPTLSSNSLGGA